MVSRSPRAGGDGVRNGPSVRLTIAVRHVSYPWLAGRRWVAGQEDLEILGGIAEIREQESDPCANRVAAGGHLSEDARSYFDGRPQLSSSQGEIPLATSGDELWSRGNGGKLRSVS